MRIQRWTTEWIGSLMALAVVSPVAAAAADRIAIDHAPVECILYDRYARIAARGTPAEGVASAQLEFRARGEGAWYSVGMVAEGTEWSVYLPRPVRPLERVEYRIVMRSTEAGEAASPVFAARVLDEGECARPGPSSSAVAAPIVVRVPEGAPAVPPVPAGFSPAGVVAVEEPARKASVWRKLAIGTGVAGGVTAAVVLGGDALSVSDLLSVPEIAFTGIAPAPGSVLSSHDNLFVSLLVTGRNGAPFSLSWTFELLGVGRNDVCLSMTGRVGVSGTLPAAVTVTGPLFPRSVCGERFDVDRAQMRLSFAGRTVFVAMPPAPFHFEP